MAVSPPSRLQAYPSPRRPVFGGDEDYRHIHCGRPARLSGRSNGAACIGRGSGMRNSSVLTSVIRMAIHSSIVRNISKWPS
ncbi:MAG: hypothetical protein MZV70_71740 [Desulfobacterales bacterium]|nr:hypothetical protein [Desulfobacterales bacterium]